MNLYALLKRLKGLKKIVKNFFTKLHSQFNYHTLPVTPFKCYLRESSKFVINIKEYLGGKVKKQNLCVGSWAKYHIFMLNRRSPDSINLAHYRVYSLEFLIVYRVHSLEFLIVYRVHSLEFLIVYPTH